MATSKPLQKNISKTSWDFKVAQPSGCLLRADSRFAPSQWETSLLCNDVSHWLGTSLESSLLLLYLSALLKLHIHSVILMGLCNCPIWGNGKIGVIMSIGKSRLWEYKDVLMGTQWPASNTEESERMRCYLHEDEIPDLWWLNWDNWPRWWPS